jgi:acetyl/propionyl-CoA carboxylase alpha subunit
MSNGRPFDRVLIANRGEIAVRIIRACRELGMEAVAVYSDSDAGSSHVRLADLAVRIGPPPPTESYLRIDRVIEAARRTGAQAIHPGYGFLAERAAFARACEEAGIVFVGPPSGAIDALGDKLAARRTAAAVDVPTVPGTLEPVPVDRPDQVAGILDLARDIGFPVMVKAAAGGGGRGMRLVERPEDLPAALVAGSSEAASAFGDGSVYIERVVRPARHIEVQLLGDDQGTVVALGERDCSVQRRHQKLIEEAPAPGLTTEQRRHLHALAVRVASAAGLRNAATCEFLYDGSASFYFLEVNTRLQVEHGVTELVSGVDIVREQFRIAAGQPLSDEALRASERAAEPMGHAIEVRVSAEDPAHAFAPTPGRVTRWVLPAGPGVRVDTGIEPGDRIPPEYDNLIAKLMVHAGDRPAALRRLARALDEMEVGGIQTTIPFHRFVAEEPDFVAGRLSTDYVPEHWDGEGEQRRVARAALLAAALEALGGAAPEAVATVPAAVNDGRHGDAHGRGDSPNGPASVGDGAAADGSGPDRSRDVQSRAWRRAGRVAGRERWPM